MHDDLGLGTFSPSLHQVFVLSKVSGYRFNDWPRVFGFNPKTSRDSKSCCRRSEPCCSILLSLMLNVGCPGYETSRGNNRIPAIAPIGRLLDVAPAQRIRVHERPKGNSFIYAKIGSEDAFAFPDLLPGSIVRANVRLAKSMLPAANGKGPECLFLIEHAKGFCCCRIRAVGKYRILPLSTQLPYAQVELELPTEVRVIGVLDLEIRSLLTPQPADVPTELAKHWRPSTLVEQESKLSQLLRSARLRMGLSLREASAMSRRVAAALGDEQYFAAPGSLSDYEALDSSPRHIHKVITLCAVYGVVLDIPQKYWRQCRRSRQTSYPRQSCAAQTSIAADPVSAGKSRGRWTAAFWSNSSYARSTCQLFCGGVCPAVGAGVLFP